LLYASINTRSDIAFAVNYVNRRFIEDSMQENITEFKHVLKYLAENIDQGMF